MGEKTKIEWTNRVMPDGSVVEGKTFNPWIGCTKVSAACAHCYAERDAERRQVVRWGPPDSGGTRFRTSPEYWQQPYRWAKAAFKAGVRPMVFCASWADVGENWPGPIVTSKGDLILRDPNAKELLVPFQHPGQPQPKDWRQRMFDIEHANPGFTSVTTDDLRNDLWRVIADTSFALDWLILTKRPYVLAARSADLMALWLQRVSRGVANKDAPERTAKFREVFAHGSSHGVMSNVWFGVTAESQMDFEERESHLKRFPAAVRFLSCEPLTGPVSIRARASGIDWVITGGESGAQARATHSSLYTDLMAECSDRRIPFFFKQWGEWAPAAAIPDQPVAPEDLVGVPYSRVSNGNMSGELQYRFGKARTGRLLRGVLYNSIPPSAL